MKYCDRCMYLTDTQACPECDKGKFLREPKPNDPVYLVTRDAIWADAIEEILRENNIPCLLKSTLGAVSIIIGVSLETFRIFVPYSAIDKAREILSSIEQAEEVGEFEQVEDLAGGDDEI